MVSDMAAERQWRGGPKGSHSRRLAASLGSSEPGWSRSASPSWTTARPCPGYTAHSRQQGSPGAGPKCFTASRLFLGPRSSTQLLPVGATSAS